MNRYDSYKDSGVEWIGQIPSEWECIRLGMLGVFSSSGIDKKSVENETPVRMVNYTDIIQSRKYYPIQTGEKRYMRVTTPKSKFEEHKLERGDMVFIPSSETYEDLGYSSLIDFDEEDIVYSYHILRYKNRKSVYHYYKKYLINHHSVLNQFSSECKGTTRQIIGRDVFNNVRVVLPPLSEQKQIVSFLDTKTSLIDTLIEKTKQKIELLKEKRTSLNNEVVTKGLNPNVEMRDSGVEWIGEIPIHWSRKKLGYLVNLQGRIGFKGYKKTDFVDEGEGCLVIGGKHIDKNNRINLSDPDYLNWEKYYESPEIMVFKGDLIVSQRGTLGKVLFIEEDYGPLTINPSLVVVNQIKENPKFLWYFLQSDSIMKTIDVLGSVTTIPMLSQEEISNFPITVPPLYEQKQIVEYLDEQTEKIDKTISIEEKRNKLLKEYRQSLISEVVTGKLKVTKDG